MADPETGNTKVRTDPDYEIGPPLITSTKGIVILIIFSST